MDSSSFKKRLVLSLGEHTYLYLATGTHRLSEGHCYIVPIRHTPASTVRAEGAMEAWPRKDFSGCISFPSPSTARCAVPAWSASTGHVLRHDSVP